jgi:hypothetical protein
MNEPKQREAANFAPPTGTARWWCQQHGPHIDGPTFNLEIFVAPEVAISASVSHNRSFIPLPVGGERELCRHGNRRSISGH